MSQMRLLGLVGSVEVVQYFNYICNNSIIMINSVHIHGAKSKNKMDTSNSNSTANDVSFINVSIGLSFD